MKLSSAYILEQLKGEYRVRGQNEITGEDGIYVLFSVWIPKEGIQGQQYRNGKVM